MSKPECTFDGCSRVAKARGLCKAHWWQWRHVGELSPLRVTLSPEERLRVNVVHTESGCILYQASGNGHGHCTLSVGNKRTYAHRFAYELENGPIPPGLVIDHICRQPSCVNPDHLRAVTVKENSQNTKTPASNTSGYKGVSWSREMKAWEAKVKYDGVDYRGGYFKTPEEANEKVVEMRSLLHTHSAEASDRLVAQARRTMTADEEIYEFGVSV